jgi:hypothetical protein
MARALRRQAHCRNRFSIQSQVSLAGLMEIWNEFVQWQKLVRPTLPAEQHVFATTMNRKTVWVIEDDAAYTLLYPEDY